MLNELKTHIAKIEAKLSKHDWFDTFTLEFVSDLVQSFKDIVEKPIDTTKDVYEIRKEFSPRLLKDYYYAYKNDNFIGICGETIEDTQVNLDKYIATYDNPKVVITREVANV